MQPSIIKTEYAKKYYSKGNTEQKEEKNPVFTSIRSNR